MTVSCPRCGKLNRDTAHYCLGCGTALATFNITCPRCQRHNRAGARFCLHCGYPVQAGVPVPPSPIQPVGSRPPVPSAGGTGQLQAKTMLAGRYIIIERVGQGGMGAVYRATDARLPGKQWAVKEMSAASLSDPAERQQAVAAFQREAQLLATLSHPHIPRVIDVFVAHDRSYLVMEFVDGETLATRLAKQKGRPLSIAEVEYLALQICDVLAYLHSQQPPIIFRDLKPSNIMLDRQQNVKLIDFGIVRFFKPGKKQDTISFGTAGYSPPEQYGKGQTDARSDIYALGATMHEMLTGRDPSGRPFHFEDVCCVVPSIPAEFGGAVMRALCLRPADRWQSAQEMRQALRRPASVPAKGVRAVPPPAVPIVAPAADALAGLMTATGLKYVEVEPGVFAASFTGQRRENVLAVVREFGDLFLLAAPISLPKRGRDKALENLLRASLDANLIKIVGSNQDGYLVVLELNKALCTGEVLAAALRGLANMADLQENQTRDRTLVKKAAEACNRELLHMPDRLNLDIEAICRSESIGCTTVAQGRYRLNFQDLVMIVLRQPTVLSLLFLTTTKARSGREDAFYHRMLEVNRVLNVGKVALDSSGNLAFLCEVPVAGLDSDSFMAAFWATLAAPGAHWDELSQIAE